MADVSKAEKLAAARRKLKQFQQKNKEPEVSNIRSTSSSLKSLSPIDILLNYKVCSQFQGGATVEETGDVGYLITPNSKQSGPQQVLTSVFSSGVDDTHDNFFDNLSQRLYDNKQVIPVIEDSEQIMNDLVTLTCTNGVKQDDFTHNVPEDENHYCQNKVSDLENQLMVEKSSNAELQTKLMESHNHVLTLQHEIKRLNEYQNQRIIGEVAELEDKIEVHLQTIEILVSEKSELQKELMFLQEENNANNSKCEELASRLKASRCQVQKLEKQLLDSSKNKVQDNSILKKLEDNIRQKDFIIQDKSQKLIEAQNEIKELNKRVELESINLCTLKKELKEMEKQLSMAQIKLTQLDSENGTDIFKECGKLKADLETAQKESERAWEEGQRTENELKQYITNLNTQVLQANAKCERAERDKDEITLRVDSLVQHISELEKQLQHEKNLRGTENDTEAITKLKELSQEQEQSLINKDKELKKVTEKLEVIKEKLIEVEIWKENVPDMGLLQQAMESDRVAAARAIEQNNTLKQKLQELEEYIIKINNSKLELTEELDKQRHMAGEYRLQLEKYKSRQEMRMVDSVTQTSYVKKSDSVSQTTYHDLSTHSSPHEPVTVETMVMIESKLKKTMDKIAELSDDKQHLEHLVLQLQSETETIGEYVTLYQNQRSLLKEKAEERERQLALIAKEREELKSKLNEINMLLTHFPHNPEVEDTTCKISSLLGEIQCSSIVQEQSGPPPTFHPCLLCSGKLITV